MNDSNVTGNIVTTNITQNSVASTSIVTSVISGVIVTANLTAGAKGDKGETGAAGPAGANGATGATGAAGQGVPTGGTTNQVLKKNSNSDYDTVWATAGTGGISRVITVTSGNYTAGSAANTDYEYLISGAHSGTLPTASGNTNRYTFKNNHSASVTLTRAGSDTIEGATSIDIPPENSVDLISNNTNAWSII